MPRYALLLRASANRVYGQAAPGLAAAELAALNGGPLGGVITASAPLTIAGVEYLAAETAEPLEPAAIAVLSNLSSLHALFEIDPDGRLSPVTVAPRALLDDDILTIQRYSGKTNEAFTHLLVNVALAASASAFERLLSGERLRLLDPACGRGTTLNRAAVYGMDAVGIELSRSDVDAYVVFLTTWLKDKRLKHTTDGATLRKGRPSPAHRVAVSYGPDRASDERRLIEVVHDDTVHAPDHVRARSIDLLVCDLPYGVQHAARAGDGAAARSPERLLEAVLPGWVGLLRPGGSIALAWNHRTLARDRLLDLVVASGLTEVVGPGESFVHQVDRSITRDVLVAISPAGF